MIWFQELKVDDLKPFTQRTLIDHLGIEFTEVGSDFLRASMPVDERTMQPMGLLHGGASCALAETVASAAAVCCINREHKSAVGLEINANHLKPVNGGEVVATARPAHMGRGTHVWHIDIRNADNDLICVARHTVAILDK